MRPLNPITHRETEKNRGRGREMGKDTYLLSIFTYIHAVYIIIIIEALATIYDLHKTMQLIKCII